MSLYFPDPSDKLAILEPLLERSKREGTPTVTAVLSAICRELRLEAPGKKDEAIVIIDRHINAVLRSKNPGGYNPRLLAGLAQEFIGRWSLIRKALEAYRGEE